MHPELSLKHKVMKANKYSCHPRMMSIPLSDPECVSYKEIKHEG